MAVIINDFEIMVEPPAAGGDQQQRQGLQEPALMPQQLRPEDIERVIRHFEDRRLRVAAD